MTNMQVEEVLPRGLLRLLAQWFREQGGRRVCVAIGGAGARNGK